MGGEALCGSSVQSKGKFISTAQCTQLQHWDLQCVKWAAGVLKMPQHHC